MDLYIHISSSLYYCIHNKQYPQSCLSLSWGWGLITQMLNFETDLVTVLIQKHPDFHLAYYYLTWQGAELSYLRYILSFSSNRIQKYIKDPNFLYFNITCFGGGMHFPSDPGEYSHLLFAFTVNFKRNCFRGKKHFWSFGFWLF